MWKNDIVVNILKCLLFTDIINTLFSSNVPSITISHCIKLSPKMKNWPFNLNSYKDVLTHITEFDILPADRIWRISSLARWYVTWGKNWEFSNKGKIFVIR